MCVFFRLWARAAHKCDAHMVGTFRLNPKKKKTFPILLFSFVPFRSFAGFSVIFIIIVNAGMYSMHSRVYSVHAVRLSSDSQWSALASTVCAHCGLRVPSFGSAIWTVHVRFVSVYFRTSLWHSLQLDIRFSSVFARLVNMFFLCLFLPSLAFSTKLHHTHVVSYIRGDVSTWEMVQHSPHTASFEANSNTHHSAHTHTWSCPPCQRQWKFYVNLNFVFISSFRSIFILFFPSRHFVLPCSFPDWCASSVPLSRKRLKSAHRIKQKTKIIKIK